MNEKPHYFETITNSVSQNMIKKLMLEGDYYQANIELYEVPTGLTSTCTALAMAIVKLYSGEDGKFKNANLGGILCFVADRELHSRFLRLYDVNSSVLLF
jgi:hypothetical protein